MEPSSQLASIAGFSPTDAWSLDLPSSSTSSAPHQEQDHQTTATPVQVQVQVQSFRHDRTYLRCQIASVPGPLCTAVVIVPTTVRDHSGLPHTLEHACFMGSRNHPSRGYLDTSALLSLSTGTNAWTDCDSTCYTITLAGTHSLAFLLPVFLDHILNPTLTPASFTTEVYHVTGKGEEQGVVMCEMMARQESESDVLDLALRRSIYGPKSTYAYECGGLTDHIRTLTMDKIKQYHKEQYRADKIAVVILGSDVDVPAVLTAVDQSPALAGVTAESYPPMPVQPLAPPFTLPPTGTTQVVRFPSEDEDTGSIAFAWQGPSLLPPPGASAEQVRDHQRMLVALDVLGRYLTDGTASPLHQALVECADAPGSDVDVEMRMYERVMIVCTVSGIGYHGRADHVEAALAPAVGKRDSQGNGHADQSSMDVDGDDGQEEDGWSTETDEGDESGDDDKDDSDASDDGDSEDNDDNMSVDSGESSESDWFAKAKLANLLRQTLTTLTTSPHSHLTLDRIHAALHRYKLHLLAQLEDDPHDALLTSWIPDLVHTTSTPPTIAPHHRDSVFTHLATLLTYPLTYWHALLHTWLIDRPHVQIMAVPSAKLAAKLEHAKRARVQAIRKKLGARGLKAAAANVTRAMAANKVNVADFAASLPAPADPTRVPQLPYADTLLTGTGDGTFPSVHLVHVPTSAFVQVKLFFHLPTLPAHLTPYLLLMQELTFHLPTLDGTPWTLNAELLNKLTSNHSCAVGLGSDVFTASYLTESLVVQFTCAPDKLALATRAVATNLLRPAWADADVHERVRVVAKHLASDVQDWKRDGSSVVGAVGGAIVGKACGLVDASLSVFVQERVLKRVGKMGDAGMQDVVGKLSFVHAQVLGRPWFAQVASAGGEDVWRVVSDEWSNVALEANVSAESTAVPPAFPFPRSPYAHAPGPVTIIPVAGITASYCSLWTPCDLLHPPTSSSSPAVHPDYFATLVLLDLLSRSEGPLFTAIRGPGLAYDASLHLATWTGTLTFDISEAGDVVPCLQALYAVLDDIQVDQLAVNQAKCALAFRYASARSSPASVAAEALRARLRGVGELTAVDAQFAEGVKRVGVEEVRRVAGGWVQRLRDPRMRRLVVVVPKGKEDKVKSELVGQEVVSEEEGEKVEVVKWGDVAKQVLGIDLEAL